MTLYIRRCKGNRNAWALVDRDDPTAWPLDTSLRLETIVKIAMDKYSANQIVITLT